MKQVSECCGAEVKVISKRGVMCCDCYYICVGCGQPCDVIEKEGEGNENESKKTE